MCPETITSPSSQSPDKGEAFMAQRGMNPETGSDDSLSPKGINWRNGYKIGVEVPGTSNVRGEDGAALVKDTIYSHEATSLRKVHDVTNEAKDIRQQLQAGLPIEYAGEYPSAQAWSVLREFATKMGNQVTYTMREGKLYAPGNTLATQTMLKKFAQNPDSGPRAQADYEGFMQIQNILNTQGIAIQISPPSVKDGKIQEGFGQYGFLNVFVREGDEVRATHVMYQENANLSESNAIRRVLQRGEHPQDAETFLTQVHRAGQVKDMGAVFKSIGREQEWKTFVADQYFFQDHISGDPYIKKWIAEYAELQVEAAQNDNPFASSEAEKRLILAYKRAQDIYKNRRHLENENTVPMRGIYNSQTEVQLLDIYYQQRLVVPDGSCSTAYSAQNTVRESGWGNYATLSAGYMKETPTHYESYKCPHCTKMIPGEQKGDRSKWRKECPHCKGRIGCK